MMEILNTSPESIGQCENYTKKKLQTNNEARRTRNTCQLCLPHRGRTPSAADLCFVHCISQENMGSPQWSCWQKRRKVPPDYEAPEPVKKPAYTHT